MVEARAQLTTAAVRRRGLIVSERRLCLTALDSIAVCTAYVLAFNLHTAAVRNVGFYLPRTGTVVVGAMWLVCARLLGAHEPRRANSVGSTVRSVGAVLGLSLAGLLAVFFAFPFEITRPTILLWAPLAGMLVLLARLAYIRVLGSSYFAGRLALVITGDGLERVWRDVRPHIGHLYEIVATIDPGRQDAATRLRSLVRGGSVDQIVLGVRDEMSRDMFRGVLECHDNGVVVRSLGDIYEELTGRLLLDQLGHTWLAALPMRSETSRLYAAFKRATDIVAALAALVLLAVILPPVLLGMLVLDRGPVFHRQHRVGKYGHVFTLWKLRTMRHAPEAETAWTAADDARITTVGRLLRKAHLDELPQAWSILRGDMSIIGPRPEQPRYVDELRSQIDFYNTRLTMRPGLTGWAQVNEGYLGGYDGARVKLSYDLYYVKHASAALDLLIIGRTLMSLLTLSGR